MNGRIHRLLQTGAQTVPSASSPTRNAEFPTNNSSTSNVTVLLASAIPTFSQWVKMLLAITFGFLKTCLALIPSVARDLGACLARRTTAQVPRYARDDGYTRVQSPPLSTKQIRILTVAAVIILAAWFLRPSRYPPVAHRRSGG